MEDKMLAMGAYTKGMFDAAASRGVLTKAATATLLNTLIALYGKGQFQVEQDQPSIPVPTPNEVQN